MELTGIAGKVALITGSTRGIGRATALAFAREGAKVVVVGTNEEKGASCVAEIKAAGGEAFFRKTDLSSEESLAGLVQETVEHYGRLDILINNAGIGDPLEIRGVQDVSKEDWDRVMMVNLTAPYLLSKEAIPYMEANGGGVVIITASVASTGAGRGPLAYTCSKHGVYGLTRELSLYHGHNGIRVNCVMPGGIATDMIAGDSDPSNPAIQKILHMPAGRLGQPEEVASVMLFLASDEASYIHGQAITVDGGFTLM